MRLWVPAKSVLRTTPLSQGCLPANMPTGPGQEHYENYALLPRQSEMGNPKVGLSEGCKGPSLLPVVVHLPLSLGCQVGCPETHTPGEGQSKMTRPLHFWCQWGQASIWLTNEAMFWMGEAVALSWRWLSKWYPSSTCSSTFATRGVNQVSFDMLRKPFLAPSDTLQAIKLHVR